MSINWTFYVTTEKLPALCISVLFLNNVILVDIAPHLLMHKLNYQQLNLAYLPRSAKFYGVSWKNAEELILEGIKRGKYNEWLIKEAPTIDRDRKIQYKNLKLLISSL